jgi:hypothetical protein
MWLVMFSLLRSWFELCNPVVGGFLLEVPSLRLGVCDCSLDQGLVQLNGRPLEQLVLRGGGPECASYLARFYTLSVCTLPP